MKSSKVFSRIMSIVLAVTLVVGMSVTSVAAPSSGYYYGKLSPSQKLAYDKLYEEIITNGNHTGTITFGVSSVSEGNQLTDDLANSFTPFVFENPKAYWIEGSIGISGTIGASGGNLVLGYSVDNTYPGATSTLVQDKVDSFVTAAKSASADKAEQVKNVHDALSAYITYDTTAPGAHQITGALLGKKAVCEGYSKAFKAIMDELEIPCVLMTGTLNKTGQDHMWNAIELDNKWYIVDVTNEVLLVGKNTKIPELNNDTYLNEYTENTFYVGLNFPTIADEEYGYVAPVPGTVAKPVANPAGGEVSKKTKVTLSCTESGATIYYTTDGTAPTTSSNQYTSVILVDSAMTIKAIAVKAGMNNSDVMTEAYTIKANPAMDTTATPVANPKSGHILKNTKVALTSEDGATIYYTTNGTTPTTSSNKYTGAITVNSAMTIKAVAVKAGKNDSVVMTESYTVYSQSKPSSGGGGGGSSNYSTINPTTTVTAASGTSVTKAQASTALAKAIAKLSDDAEVVRVTFKNVKAINKDVIDALAKQAAAEGLDLKINLDTVKNGKITGRLVIQPGVSSDKEFNAGFIATRETSLEAFFGNFFDNDIKAVSLQQSGKFAKPVEVIVKLPSGMNTDDLVVYSYNAETNKFKVLDNANAWVDNSGYVHFTTNIGGDFIISDGALS